MILSAVLVLAVLVTSSEAKSKRKPGPCIVDNCITCNRAGRKCKVCEDGFIQGYRKRSCDPKTLVEPVVEPEPEVVVEPEVIVEVEAEVVLDTPAVPWRDDLRCGPDFALEDGSPAECAPNNADGHVCCSPSGHCGKTEAHCDCLDCIDYSPYKPVASGCHFGVCEGPKYRADGSCQIYQNGGGDAYHCIVDACPAGVKTCFVHNGVKFYWQSLTGCVFGKCEGPAYRADGECQIYQNGGGDAYHCIVNACPAGATTCFAYNGVDFYWQSLTPPEPQTDDWVEPCNFGACKGPNYREDGSCEIYQNGGGDAYHCIVDACPAGVKTCFVNDQKSPPVQLYWQAV